MAIDQAAALNKIRDLIAGVEGLRVVYSAASADAGTRIPMALNVLPCAMVIPGETQQYILSAGQHRHTYEVMVQVFAAGADSGLASSVAAPMPDRIIGVLMENVALGGLVNSCLFERSGGLRELEYGGGVYRGYEIWLRVSEQASAAPAYGG